MALTFNHQTNSITNATGTVTFNGVVVGGDNTPNIWFGSRGVFAGGDVNGAGSAQNVIDYITIASTGNATDFGDLTVARRNLGGSGCSNGTRGVFGGGTQSGDNDTIDYITIANTGNATDFGNLSVARTIGPAGASNSTRGLWGGGIGGTDVIDYITIANTGNATDFGNLSVARWGAGVCSNGTRVAFAGGAGSEYDVIDYVAIDTTGNAADFGNLSVARYYVSGCSSEAGRGVFDGGEIAVNPFITDVIDYIDISTTGNATDFGNLLAATKKIAACSDGSRGVFGGGANSSNSSLNTIQYITIASTGNSTDFGDLTVARDNPSAVSGT